MWALGRRPRRPETRCSTSIAAAYFGTSGISAARPGAGIRSSATPQPRRGSTRPLRQPTIARPPLAGGARSEEHTSELQSRLHLVCRLLLEKKKKQYKHVLLVVDSMLPV